MSSCCICLSPFSEQFVVLIRCGHCYCNECIREWLARNLSCPTCKKGTVSSDCVTVKTSIKESVQHFVQEQQNKPQSIKLSESEASLLKELIHEASDQSTIKIEQDIEYTRQLAQLQQTELNELQFQLDAKTTELTSIHSSQSLLIQSIDDSLVRVVAARDQFKAQRDKLLDDRFQVAHRRAIQQINAIFTHLDIQSINQSVNQLVDQIFQSCFNTSVIKKSLSINRSAFLEFIDKYVEVSEQQASSNQSINQATKPPQLSQQSKDLMFKLMQEANVMAEHSNSLITSFKSTIYDSLIDHLSSRLAGGFGGQNDEKEEFELQTIQRKLRELQSQQSQIAHAIQNNTKQASIALREAELLRSQKKPTNQPFNQSNLPSMPPSLQRSTSLFNQSSINQSINQSNSIQRTPSLHSNTASGKSESVASVSGVKRAFSHIGSAGPVASRPNSGKSMFSSSQPGSVPQNPFFVTAANAKPKLVPLRDKGTESSPIVFN